MKGIKLLLGLSIGVMTISCNSNTNKTNIETQKNFTDLTRQEEIEYIKKLDFSSETFNEIDKERINKLNEQIKQDSITEIQNIINNYTPYITSIEGAGSSHLFIDRNISNNKIEVISISTGQSDDSAEAVKTIYTFELLEDDIFPKLLSIKQNFRCQQDRGQITWDAKLCN